jgi:CubicO group peptidase (beta-lactamase class C family)
VNIWTGVADERDARRWEASTRSVIFSATKGMSALVVGWLVQRGMLDLDAPVASLWPEFGAHGKDRLTIGDALAHRAGLSAPDADLTLGEVRDRTRWAARVASQVPLWQPGSGHAYHAVTYGLLAEQIVRRASGRELHELFATEIAAPLGAEVTLFPDSRIADAAAWLIASPAWAEATVPDPLVARAVTLGSAMPVTLIDGADGFNSREVRTLGLAGAGGIGTASGLARIWSAAITETRGVRLLDDATLAKLTRARSEGRWVLEMPGPYQRWGAGVELSSDAAPMLSPRSFGHGGAGGQAAFADPESGTAVAYVRNRLDFEDPMPPLLAAVARAG